MARGDRAVLQRRIETRRWRRSRPPALPPVEAHVLRATLSELEADLRAIDSA
jgi:hypothetical protein